MQALFGRGRLERERSPRAAGSTLCKSDGATNALQRASRRAAEIPQFADWQAEVLRVALKSKRLRLMRATRLEDRPRRNGVKL
jgi:hypothetical protein